MATFTIDLFTGKQYLFNNDFGGTGSTPTSGSTYVEVNLFTDLPAAAAHSGEIYVVRSGSGTYVVDRKEAGFYFSNGAAWTRLGNTIAFFNSTNFQVYDNADNTNGLMFITSGITGGTFRQLTIQNLDGVIAYLSDVSTKVGLSLFSGYTGTTNTRILGIEADIDYISGVTDTKLGITRTAITGTTYIPTNNDVIVGILGTVNGVVDINLPDISVIDENIYWIFKDEGFNAETNNINFNAFAGNLIEKQTTVALAINGGSITIYNDGISNWYIV
jgi:hypothetical protein